MTKDASPEMVSRTKSLDLRSAALLKSTLLRRETLLTLRRRTAAGKEQKFPDEQIAMGNPNPTKLKTSYKLQL
ncbi:unnamed protein product [Urochloa humidicola]